MKVRSHSFNTSVARGIAFLCAAVFANDVRTVQAGIDQQDGVISATPTSTVTAAIPFTPSNTPTPTVTPPPTSTMTGTPPTPTPTTVAGINAWTSHGPGTVGISLLAIDPTTPSTLFAGTALGVFKSTDNSGSWQAVADLSGNAINAGLPPFANGAHVSAFIIDPTIARTLYAGTSAGVFKSTDGGGRWQAVNAGLSSTYVTGLAIDTRMPGTLYAGTGVFCYVSPVSDRRGDQAGTARGRICTGGGVFKSTDGGESWQAGNAGLPNDANVTALASDPSTPGTLYASTRLCFRNGCSGIGVFKSTDGAASWQAVNTGLPDGVGVTTFAIDSTTLDTLYAATTAGVFKSTGGGDSWAAVNAGLPGNVFALAIDPITPSTLYAVGTFFDGGGGVFKSTDGAVSWHDTGLPRNNAYGPAVGVLVIDPIAPGTLYAGMGSPDGVFFKSTDGASSWAAVNTTGLPGGTLDITALTIDPLTPTTVYAATTGFGFFKSTDGGTDWQATSLLTSAYVYALVIDPNTPGTLYAGANLGVFKSTDGASSWQAVRNAYVEALVIDPTRPGALYAGTLDAGAGGDVLSSTDGGGTWRAVSVGLPTRHPGFGVQALAIDPTTPSTLFAGTNIAMFRSTDGAASWQEADTGLANPFVDALAIDPATPGTLYAGTDGGVFKSTDSAGTWGAAGPGLPNFGVSVLVVDPLTSRSLYVGSRGGGVLRSTDGAVSWREVNTGLTNLNVAALAIDSLAPSTLYAGTFGGGVFSIQQNAACTGDCNGTHTVAINDLITLVNIALGNAELSACPNGVPSGGEVDVAVVIRGVNNALNGCSIEWRRAR